MNKWRVLGAGLALFLVVNWTAQADPPAGVTKQALAFVTLLADQKDQDAFDQFDDQVKAGLPSDKLKAVWQEVIGQQGAFKNTGQTKTAEVHGYTVVYVESVFERGSLWVQVAYDKDGKIGGLHFLPKTTEQP
jgi:hypothetical protein